MSTGVVLALPTKKPFSTTYKTALKYFQMQRVPIIALKNRIQNLKIQEDLSTRFGTRSEKDQRFFVMKIQI